METLSGTWLRWTRAVTLGKVAGIGLAIWVTAAVVSRSLDVPSLWGASAAILVAAFAGLAEGAAVGAAQARMMKRVLGISPVSWTIGTALATGLAWAGAMTVNAAMLDRYFEPATVAWTIVALGLVLGAAVGQVQALLSKHRLGAAWIIANGIAWLAGTALAIGIASRVGPDSGATEVTMAILAIGVLVGLVVGSITGAALVRTLHRNAS